MMACTPWNAHPSSTAGSILPWHRQRGKPCAESALIESEERTNQRESRILEGSLVTEHRPGKQKVDWRRSRTISPYVLSHAAAMPPLAPTSSIFCLSLAPLSHHATQRALASPEVP